MIDRINLDILRCLRENARCKASEISHKVNLSVSAVIERIHRMRPQASSANTRSSWTPNRWATT